MVELKVAPLCRDNRDDFYAIHCEENKAGWCYCVAWWTTTWNAWSLRIAEENKTRRQHLFEMDLYDGYILYADNRPVGWCQCGPRDRLPNLRNQYAFALDSEIWAITCFLIIPEFREIGLTHYFLKEILKDLRKKGIMYVQGFPKRGHNLSTDNVWTGPEAVFKKAGFVLERDDPVYPIYGLSLDAELPEDK